MRWLGALALVQFLLLIQCAWSDEPPENNLPENLTDDESGAAADIDDAADDDDAEDAGAGVAEKSVEEILSGIEAGTDDYILHTVERTFFPDVETEETTEDQGDEDSSETDDDDNDDGLDDAPYKRNKKWKDGWKQHPLYIIILGGFRWDFLGDRYTNLTSFAYLMQHGTTVSRVKPVFPPEDFPVWTSMSTGCYPADHHITGDVMYNLKSRSYFNRSDVESRRQLDWWKWADPFWSTAGKHGRKVAFFNWHDCQLPGGKAVEDPERDCLPYQNRGGGRTQTGMPTGGRQMAAAQFDQALTKIHKDHYDVSVVYTDLVKRAAERYGPNSAQLFKAMQDVDDILQEKLYDLRNKKELKDKVNVMVISDYGLSDMDSMEDVVMEDYLDLDDTQSIVYTAGYAAITPFALGHNKILLDAGSMPGIDAYLTSQVQRPRIWHGVRVPDSLHFGDGEWTTDVLLVARPGYRLMTNSKDKKLISVNGVADDSILKGAAGYNPQPDPVLYPKLKKGQKLTQEINDTLKAYGEFERFKYDMHTQAFLLGPDFKAGYEMREEIEVVDFYQIICFLLDIPAGDKHSGSWERIQDMLTISGSPKATGCSPLILLLNTLMLCAWAVFQ